MSLPRLWQLVVWGATGFTGELIVKHLLARAPAGLRWAIGPIRSK